MPNFHDTGMGHKFFNVQLPKLTSTLVDLVVAINANTQAITESNDLKKLEAEPKEDRRFNTDF